MTPEITAALIALSGVLISVLVTVLINYRQTVNELTKLRTEVQQEFSRRLFEKRFEAYPKLYSGLSKFIKVIQFGKISNQSINELFDYFQEWDTQNAFLFSGYTGKISYDVRLLLAELIKMSDDELQKAYETPEALKELRHKMQELEIALKNELGIYAYESPTTVTEVKSVKSYQDVTDSFYNRKRPKN